MMEIVIQVKIEVDEEVIVDHDIVIQNSNPLLLKQVAEKALDVCQQDCKVELAKQIQ